MTGVRSPGQSRKWNTKRGTIHFILLSSFRVVRDGRLVKQLAEAGAGYPGFSPDGCWLSTGLDGGRLFAVGTWEPGPRVGGSGVFAPDSRLMAVPYATGVIRLVDPVTGRELATLEDPDLDAICFAVFTPDGTKLIDYNNGKVKGIRVWDLRLIRQHLAKMGLDWDAPPYPPAAPGSQAIEPLKVEAPGRPRSGIPGAERFIPLAFVVASRTMHYVESEV